jgi:hypothetical protein
MNHLVPCIAKSAWFRGLIRPRPRITLHILKDFARSFRLKHEVTCGRLLRPRPSITLHILKDFARSFRLKHKVTCGRSLSAFQNHLAFTA